MSSIILIFMNKIYIDNDKLINYVIGMNEELLMKGLWKAGNKSNLAKALGFSRQMLHQVIKGKCPLPEKRKLLLIEYLKLKAD